MPAHGKARIIAALLVGTVLGLGLFTIHYAHGTAYLSSDPEACINCHIMQPQYDAWLASTHHAVAGCVDCHLPHDNIIAKYVAKSINGWNHSKAFTLQDFHEPIAITEANARLLQENCVRCHGELVHDQVTADANEAGAIRCTHCHASVGHGDAAGLGGPDRGEHRERTGS